MIAGGGFEYESEMLIQNLGDEFNYVFLTSGNESRLKKKLAEKGQIFVVKTMFNMSVRSPLQKAFRLTRAIWQMFPVIHRTRPDAVIWIGDALGIPAAIWAKIHRIKVAYIESVTRVTKPSLTGKIVEYLSLADKVYVQWPESVSFYKKAVYKGWVL